jgi:ribonuclease D
MTRVKDKSPLLGEGGGLQRVMQESLSVSVQYIDTAEAMIAAGRHLCGHAIVALDLEADSMFHFSERICLIQAAAADGIYVIDPLAVSDISPLQRVVEDPAIRKVLHGADYDVRCLYRDYGIRIRNLFDTELAARFLGYAETGLNALLRQHFGILLEKKFQKKDWSQRPLPEEMTAYAADDVRYLIALHHRLESELAGKGRLEWVLEECEALSRVRPEPMDARPHFTRFKGAGRLDPRSLAVLEALLEMRLEKARQKNRPPFKIIGNAALLQLARIRPLSMQKLKSLNILSRRQLSMYGSEILSAIKAGVELPAAELPRYPAHPRPTRSAKAASRMRRLKEWRRKEAGRLGIEPGVLLSNAQIRTLAENLPASAEDPTALSGLRKWQSRAYGKQLLQILSQKEGS